MKLNVARELRQPGFIGRYHAEETLGGQEYMGRELKFAEPASIDAECVFDGEGISVWGTISAKLNSECALCGKPYVESLSFGFDERFVREPDPDGECYGCVGEELDMSKMIMDNLLLNLPVYGKCREDCKGLCPVCGCDLNTERCSCVREDDKNNPFSVLEQLLYHDKEV